MGQGYSERLPYVWKDIGVSRTEVINTLIALNHYNSYLEIGCQSDVNFAKVPVANKIGVDPCSGGTHRMTSDAFFEQNKTQFDVVFIDGLHSYEQVRRDVINSLTFLKEGGVIVLHDMLPLSWESEHMPRINGSSSGTTWKIAYELIAYFKNKFCIVVADTGLGVIFYDKKLDLSHFGNKYDIPYSKKSFRDFLNDYTRFNLVTKERLDAVLKTRALS